MHGRMRLLATLAALAALLAAPACDPKLCDPGQIPEQFQDIARVMPSSAVACGVDDKGSLRFNFPDAAIKLHHEHIALQLKGTGWTLFGDQQGEGWSNIIAIRGDQTAHINVNTQRNGPTLGSIKLGTK